MNVFINNTVLSTPSSYLLLGVLVTVTTGALCNRFTITMLLIVSCKYVSMLLMHLLIG